MTDAKTRPRVVLLTSAKRRHRYVAARLAETANLVGILSEEKVQQPGASTEEAEAAGEDQKVIQEHFARRDEAEAHYLGDARFPDGDVPRIERPYGAANDRDVFDWVQERNPDFVVLYGTSIIKPPLLDAYEGRMVNLHLGLSPYYRGSGTNFWPLVNGEPECVGATLHLAVEEVDAGAILAQVRPDAERSDRAHDLGTKTIIEAVEALPNVLAARADGSAPEVQQDTQRGKVYRRSDFSADAVRRMWSNFEEGMMEEYVANREKRRAGYPITPTPEEASGDS